MMPELPEVETLCCQLNAILPGKKVLAVEILDPRLGERKGDDLTGRKIEAVYRQGKCIRMEIGKRGRLSGMSPEKHQGKVKKMQMIHGRAASPDDRPSSLADRRDVLASVHAPGYDLFRWKAALD
jgi:formamidopyrimidine-DNA glycosylase